MFGNLANKAPHDTAIRKKFGLFSTSTPLTSQEKQELVMIEQAINQVGGQVADEVKIVKFGPDFKKHDEYIAKRPGSSG